MLILYFTSKINCTEFGFLRTSSESFVPYTCFLSEPYVTEDELKLMLRGAELSGAIAEDEQVRQ
jgi:hypothetical protein